MSKMSIAKRVSSGFAMVIIIMALVCVGGIVSMSKVREQVSVSHSEDSIKSACARLDSVQNITVLGTLIAVIACVVISRSVIRYITRPLGQISDVMQQVRNGDLSKRALVERQDEMGIISENLNETCDSLSRLIGKVQESGIKVNAGINEIAATLKEQQATANEVASTSVEIGATAKEISATARELGSTMNDVAKGSEQTAQLATSGHGNISRLEGNMQQIMSATSTISTKLAVLNEKMANINTVVTTINKVADQTNLLSLNAAIEAEKAGEYGQGFSVVATEIRRLADQTAVATYDIEQMVKEMQSAVAAGVMGMDKFNEEVRRGVEEVRLVTEQFNQIIQQIQTLSPRFESVNEGMQAQATAARQISDALGQLGDTTQHSAQAFRQNTEAIELLSSASRSLQESVSQFHVR